MEIEIYKEETRETRRQRGREEWHKKTKRETLRG